MTHINLYDKLFSYHASIYIKTKTDGYDLYYDKKHEQVKLKKGNQPAGLEMEELHQQEKEPWLC